MLPNLVVSRKFGSTNAEELATTLKPVGVVLYLDKLIKDRHNVLQGGDNLKEPT